MEDTKVILSMGNLMELGSVAYNILSNYGVTFEELINALQIYAEWQENVGLADLNETLWMDDGTPMTPSLTRYLYHQMYGLSDVYDDSADEEDGNYDE